MQTYPKYWAIKHFMKKTDINDIILPSFSIIRDFLSPHPELPGVQYPNGKIEKIQQHTHIQAKLIKLNNINNFNKHEIRADQKAISKKKKKNCAGQS